MHGPSTPFSIFLLLTLSSSAKIMVMYRCWVSHKSRWSVMIRRRGKMQEIWVYLHSIFNEFLTPSHCDVSQTHKSLRWWGLLLRKLLTSWKLRKRRQIQHVEEDGELLDSSQSDTSTLPVVFFKLEGLAKYIILSIRLVGKRDLNHTLSASKVDQMRGLWREGRRGHQRDGERKKQKEIMFQLHDLPLKEWRKAVSQSHLFLLQINRAITALICFFRDLLIVDSVHQTDQTGSFLESIIVIWCVFLGE